MAKRKLDFCIPVYKEGEEVVKPLLDSIQNQHNVDMNDIGVIICSDGDEEDNTVISDLLMSIYDYHIEFHKEKHGGVSATRDKCFSYSDAEYVMYCDCDDMLFNMLGVRMIFDEIENSHFDVLVSCFLEEGKMPGTEKLMYLPHEVDHTFVHGKVFRSEFLRDQNIRWNPELRVHEDSFYNCLAIKIAGEKAVYMPSPFYLWCWRSESVCRRDRKYILKTMIDMLKSNTALVKQFIDRDHEDDAIFYATSMIFDCYWTLNEDSWMDEENKEYRDITEAKFKEYWNNFQKLFEKIKPEVKIQIMAGIRQRKYMEGLGMEKVTFDQWINHIEEL